MKRDWTTSGPDLHLALAAAGTRRAALEDALRAAIRDGRLTAGTRLPSTRALAGDLGLSRGSVVEAFAQLTAEGYLDARHGAGTWVADLSLPGTQRMPPLERPARAARFSFSPGLPDLTSFPQAAWMSALRQGLRGVAAASLGYGDPRGRRDLREQLAWYLRTRSARRSGARGRVRGFSPRPLARRPRVAARRCVCDRNGGSLRGTASGGGGERAPLAPPATG